VIHLRNFPRAALGPLWDLLDVLAREKRLIAPREVFREVAKMEDVGHGWARDHRTIFVDPDAKQGAIVGRLQTTYPVLNVPSKPIHADPWCLALTQLSTTAKQACYLINEERDTAQASDKLPWLCKDLGLKWARLLDIPSLEGLRFTLSKV
jgi:hypothetical protein